MTGLITLLIVPLNGLMGFTPIISRVITQLQVGTKSHGPPSRLQGTKIVPNKEPMSIKSCSKY